MAVIMAEQMTGPKILHVEPARWETDNRDHEFPAVVAAIGRKKLHVDPGSWLWMDSVDVQNSVS